MRLLIFALGLLCGGLAWFIISGFLFPEPVFTFTAKVKMDAGSNEDWILDGEYIDNPGLYYGRIQLKYPSNTTHNNYDKNVKVTGPLRTERLKNGNYLTILLVKKIELLPQDIASNMKAVMP